MPSNEKSGDEHQQSYLTSSPCLLSSVTTSKPSPSNFDCWSYEKLRTWFIFSLRTSPPPLAPFWNFSYWAWPLLLYLLLVKYSCLFVIRRHYWTPSWWRNFHIDHATPLLDLLFLVCFIVTFLSSRLPWFFQTTEKNFRKSFAFFILSPLLDPSHWFSFRSSLAVTCNDIKHRHLLQLLVGKIVVEQSWNQIVSFLPPLTKIDCMLRYWNTENLY